MIARSVLLRPGGPLASELGRHAVVLKIDDWVFCHGGLLPHHGKTLVSKLCTFLHFFSLLRKINTWGISYFSILWHREDE